mmetsp:Transcript_30810/g.62089  ORF Transcript_30810/g.62089 Transcript_30810/m.62089 type:complete len:270 (+) Transcript_30810:263-1072(+)
MKLLPLILRRWSHRWCIPIETEGRVITWEDDTRLPRSILSLLHYYPIRIMVAAIIIDRTIYLDLTIVPLTIITMIRGIHLMRRKFQRKMRMSAQQLWKNVRCRGLLARIEGLSISSSNNNSNHRKQYHLDLEQQRTITTIPMSLDHRLLEALPLLLHHWHLVHRLPWRLHSHHHYCHLLLHRRRSLVVHHRQLLLLQQHPRHYLEILLLRLQQLLRRLGESVGATIITTTAILLPPLRQLRHLEAPQQLLEAILQRTLQVDLVYPLILQ